MHDIEGNALGQPARLESGVQFMRLVDGNLRILISVQNEEGRILPIDVKFRRSEPREIGLVFRLGAQKKLEDWDANPKTVRSGLLEDGENIGGTVEIDDGVPPSLPCLRGSPTRTYSRSRNPPPPLQPSSNPELN
jgi:hypothetical protein